MNIQNRIAFVTGANRGIGAAIVKELLAQGISKVYAASRQIENLPDFQSDKVYPLTLDLTNAESIQRAAEEARDVNLLINNAGTLDFGDIFNVSNEQLDRNFSVNFFAPIAMAKAFRPTLKAHGNSAIINMLTLLSLASMPGMAAYNASKAAAWSAHLSMRASLSPDNINVHGVFPGAVDTDMLAGVEMPKASPTDVAHEIIEGLKIDQEDIFPDTMSKDVYAAWKADHKAVEKQFAQL
ncbi:MAG: NAD(P)-dependent dehydrogenase (short-subunit alcohol dehydrogenase family) [Flavobacteriales bacterium]|jgi:NAD(P)-dependent dehydrogenase (short-subunit alcohol dehydrogenase family)